MSAIRYTIIDDNDNETFVEAVKVEGGYQICANHEPVEEAPLCADEHEANRVIYVLFGIPYWEGRE